MRADELTYFDPDLTPDTKLCRYISFSKFVDMLETQALFLPFASQMSDQFEGVPYHNEDVLELIADTKRAYGKMAKDSAKKAVEKRSEENTYARRASTFIGLSCWTKYDESECYLMWRAYTNTLDGIAVVTTVEKLLGSMRSSEVPLYLARVLYQPDQAHKFPNDFIGAYFRKRPLYEREHEVRLVASLLDLEDTDLPRHRELVARAMQDEGISLAIDVKSLVDEVILAPDAPRRLVHLVERLCRRCGIEVDFKRSELSQKPILYDPDRGTVSFDDKSLEHDFVRQRDFR